MTSNRALLRTYLAPQFGLMIALSVLLLAAIALQLALPLLTARFIDRASDGAPHRELLNLAIITMLLAVFGQGLGVLQTWTDERISWSAANTLRLDLARHVLRLDHRFHAEHTQGDLIERVDGDVRTLARFFSSFVINVAGNVLLILGIVGVLWGIDWRIGLGVTLFVVAAFTAMLWIRARATPSWVQQRQASADFYGLLGEYLSGTEDVRSSGAREFVLRRFTQSLRSWLPVTTRAGMWGYSLVASIDVLFLLSTAFALGMCGVLFHRGDLSLGAVFLAVRLTGMLSNPTYQLRNEIEAFQQADASLKRVRGLFAQQPSIVDGIGTSLPAGPLMVEFDAVDFGYDPAELILHDISFRLPPGRVLGIVGRTGSGKSTIARLIPRLLDPTAGVVRLNGVDIRELRLSELRSRIGVVSQEVQLFDATVRDNLTLFADREAFSDDQLRSVLDSLGMGPWFSALPAGLETKLGAGGIGLSAGQIQVLSCARLLIRDPDLVVLDEASARLDSATERLVHDALGKLLAGRTAVMIAHRLDTLSFADDIVVLQNGRIAEYGERTQLAADPHSRFAALLQLDLQEVAR